MGALWGSLIGALLPEPQRSAVERRWGGDPPLVSFMLGFFEFVAGVNWLYQSAMAVLLPMADRIATAYLEEANRRTVGSEETAGFTLGGAVLWLGWLIRPTTWLLISIPLVGLLRVSAFMTTRTAVAEPTVWALVRFVTFSRERGTRARERAAFGAADEPDEVEAGVGNELLVYAARARPEWNELVTIEVDDRYYRVTGHEPVERPGHSRHRYRLTEAGEHDVIRRLLRYRPPQSGIRWAVASRSEGAGSIQPGVSLPASTSSRSSRIESSDGE